MLFLSYCSNETRFDYEVLYPHKFVCMPGIIDELFKKSATDNIVNYYIPSTQVRAFPAEEK